MTLRPKDSEQLSGRDMASVCSLVGAKSKVYDRATVSDAHEKLHLITDQPDAIGGGTIADDVYYLVDNDDTNLIVKCGEKFVIPAP